MLLIVEGNDCSGKTTFTKRFREANVVHFGAPATDEEAYNYWKVYAKAIEEADDSQLTIFDRCWLSDCVYGPVMRGRQEMAYEMANMLNAAAAAKGGILVYCRAPLKVLKQRYKQRGDDYIKDFSSIEKLQSEYEKALAVMKNIPILVYQTN